MDRQTEVLRLGKAERPIVDAERNVTRQQFRLNRLQADGHDTKTAKKMLRDCEKTVESLREHREIIVKMIEQIEHGLA